MHGAHKKFKNHFCRMKPRRDHQRFDNNPDDVFLADVQRPLDPTTTISRRAPLPFEEHRRLCNAVIDGTVDVLRSLLVDHGLDVNARSSTGQTPGHQVNERIHPSHDRSLVGRQTRNPSTDGGYKIYLCCPYYP